MSPEHIVHQQQPSSHTLFMYQNVFDQTPIDCKEIQILNIWRPFVDEDEMKNI